MPTYDLTCTACGHRYDRFIPRMLRDEDRVCPECGASGMKVGVGGGILGSGTASSSPVTIPHSTCSTGSFG